jgi:hypothetical protein
MTATMLPPEFADLEPFAAAWCLPTEPERWARRLSSTMDEMQAFYDASVGRAGEAIAFCDRFDLRDMPPTVERLLHMLCSLALVSYAIEVWQQPLPIDTGSARLDRTHEPHA